MFPRSKDASHLRVIEGGKSKLYWPEFEDDEPESDPFRGIIRGVVIGTFCFWLPLALVIAAWGWWRTW